MRQIILALPLPVAPEQGFSFFQEAGFAVDGDIIRIPGSPFGARVALQNANQDLIDSLSPMLEPDTKELNSLLNHASIAFIIVAQPKPEHMRDIREWMQRLIAKGIPGCYMEQCGLAVPSRYWHEPDSEYEDISCFINLVHTRGALHSLGMEAFDKPDLTMTCPDVGETELSVLLSLAEAMVFANEIPELGDHFTFGDYNTECLGKTDPLMPKGSDHHNPFGALRFRIHKGSKN